MNSRHRLLFSKDGTARYISHLDLMRTIQRAFLRAELGIRHTEGFNPHAFVSIALPLPVGHSSQCELLDFELLGEKPLEEVPERLNAVLPEGLRIQKAYTATRPFKELLYLQSEITLFYDGGVPAGAKQSLSELFSRERVIIIKKTKRKAEAEIDLIPLIKKMEISESDGRLIMQAVVCAQNPSLNPEGIVTAIRNECPSFAPDFAAFRRLAVLDNAFHIYQ